MAEDILEVSDKNFDTEVMKSEKPVVVDFWAPWCGPCKAMEPVMKELAATHGSKVKFTKCNVDDNPISPGKFGIKAIPTLIFFKAGSVVDQLTGVTTKSKLEKIIQKMS